MDFVVSLLPTIEHVGVIGYWLVLLVSLAESLAFVGVFVPGGIIVILAGFLSAQGYLDVGDVIWFAAVGAILGDSLSYGLGTKGVRFFRNENRILKVSHLENAERFFKKHGEKSILLGRFIGIMRPIIPFVAGLSRMPQRTFLFWNIIGGVLWAFGYVLLGYFFGGAAGVIEVWTTRVGLFVFIALVSIVALWFMVTRSKPIFLFLFSIAVSIRDAIISNPDVRKLVRRYPTLFASLKRRLNKEKFSGLPLTLILVSFVYVASLFLGIVEDVISSDSIVAADGRIANLLYAFRDMELITFFTWVTLLGKWQIIFGGTIVATILLWMWQKKAYILPLWFTLIGSEIFNLLGKIAFHRPRPDIAYYIELGFSFPSGHATLAVAFYGFLTYFFVRETKKWRRKVVILFLGLVVIFAIGLSRLYLGVHYVSDVWGGFLSGSLILIIGIALVEWMKQRQRDPTSFRASSRVKGTSGILVAALVGFYVLFALRYHPPIRIPQREQTIVVDSALEQFQENKIPHFTETLLGNNQEPLSFIIQAKNDEEFVQAMDAAGWRLADIATTTSVFTVAGSAIIHTNYPTAPMTPSFWNAKVHDFGFEKETSAKNVKERHHARFWKTDLQTVSGERVYVGTASFDSGIKWFVTHKISPDIDTERELLFADLQAIGVVADSYKTSFVQPVLGKNFSGDPFFTDGKIYVLVVAKR